MNLARTLLVVSGLLVALTALACDEKEAVGLRIEVAADLSGRLVVSSLHDAGTEGHAEDSSGANWQGSAELRASRAAVPSLEGEGLRWAGIVVRVTRLDEEGRFMGTVEIPTGPDAPWIDRLVPRDAEARRRVRGAMDPDDKAADLGEFATISLRLPQKPDLAHLRNGWPGLAPKTKDRTVSLELDLGRVRGSADGPLRWEFLWGGAGSGDS